MSRKNYEMLIAKAGSRQWTGWVFPAATGECTHWPMDEREPAHVQHRLICCDCGLAHDFEFVVIELDDKGNLVRPAPFDKYGVIYRVRRNEHSTSAIRRTTRQDCVPRKRRRA